METQVVIPLSLAKELADDSDWLSENCDQARGRAAYAEQSKQLRQAIEAAERKPVCNCDPEDWGGDEPSGICVAYLPENREIINKGFIELCAHCGHDKSCHEVKA